MNPLDIHEIGEIVRKVRKERGLRLEDLADENISPATISNIERGVPHVSMKKAHYLLSKLDIDLHNLPDLIMKEQKEHQDLNFQLLSIESMCTTQHTDKALHTLEQLDIDDGHPYASTVLYLIGKCHIQKKNWKRAERILFKAVQLTNQGDPTHNIEAASLAELGLCSYYQNDLDSALKYTENGLTAFDPQGDRPHVQFVLKQNKAVYLERLGRIGESMRVVESVWESLPFIDESNMVLTFYWLRSELLRRSKVYEDAILFATEGLEKARRNTNYNLMYDLWTVLGSVYMDNENWDSAKTCFNRALELEEFLSSKHKFIVTYARLGVLYIQLNAWEDAKIVIEKSIQFGKEYNDIPRLTYALHTMGDFYRLQGESQEAISYYQHCYELCHQHHLKEKEYQALLRLAQCWEETNEVEFQKHIRNMYEVQLQLNKLGGRF
ncbi:Transcriptional regulator, contains XRE-family HTH domain [Marininema mesophilum]|uniref:Transcriptional regulator, contains XRE-family HTH domain n=1 Tax=Marininema mesophilum TaxID=1048340 RepID=A0A1H2PZ60_9BACL|nr:tetratricopeptide repeat protein [Marininema mesophilum]SDW00111.1 Transcriptional regulator, contains XRE-family HTH domain [Marininema mesophilum]